MSTYSTSSPVGCLRGGLLVRDLRLLVSVAAFEHRVGNLRGEQANGAQSVIIARNDPVHQIGIAIGVHDATTGMPMRRASFTAIASALESITNMASGSVVMFSMPRKILVQVLHFAVQPRALLSSRAAPCGRLRSWLSAVFRRLMDFCSVAQLVSVPPKPAVIHVEHARSACASSAMASCAWRLVPTNRTVLALRGEFADKAAGFAEHLQGLLQIDDVNAVAFAENIFLHFRIPAARLVAEVNSGLQQAPSS